MSNQQRPPTSSKHSDYLELLEEALDCDAFGGLEPMERTLLVLRTGANDAPRDVTEVALKLGQSGEWVGAVEQALVERLRSTRYWPQLQRLQALA